MIPDYHDYPVKRVTIRGRKFSIIKAALPIMWETIKYLKEEVEAADSVLKMQEFE